MSFGSDRRIRDGLWVLSLGLALAATGACGGKRVPTRPWDLPSKGEGVKQKAVKALDVVFRVRIWPTGREKWKPAQMLDSAAAEIGRVARMVSPQFHLGELKRVNTEAPRKPVVVSPEFYALLKAAKAMYDRSGGAFNVTYQPGVTKDGDRTTEFDLVFDDKFLSVRFASPQTQLNLNGMARGYAAQKALERLRGFGLAGAAVTAGGFAGVWREAAQDPLLMCVENPTRLGSCHSRIEPAKSDEPLFLGVSASAERRGKLYHPSADWSYRSGGVVVAGADGAWTQFAATITGVMTDEALDELFSETRRQPRLVGVYFQALGGGLKTRLAGNLAPFAKVIALARD
ncbi:MAG: FAD:protein FMN transferase [Bdellovibrionales bacterium]|nr:FAD:protein FMN transferase [Bdellovibrionales bacterium]